jgi:hypothetical protein
MTDLTPVPAAEAVLLKPLPPIDYRAAAIVLGNLFGSSLDADIAQRLVAAAALLPDSLDGEW